MEDSKLKKSFGLVAKDYQKYRRNYDRELYDLLFSLLPKKDLSGLDIGCGTGKSTEPLLEFSPQKISVIGIDPDEAMLDEARLSAKQKKLAINYIKEAAEKLPFEEKSFDAVISGAAFHWFGSKETLAKIEFVLKDKGIIFIFWSQYVKSNKSVIGSEIFGKYKWKGIPKEFREQKFVLDMLVDSGFKNVRKHTFSYFEKKTIPEIIGNFKTNSSYALMSEELRKQFLDEMTEAYTLALAGKEFDENELELRVCYGFK